MLFACRRRLTAIRGIILCVEFVKLAQMVAKRLLGEESPDRGATVPAAARKEEEVDTRSRRVVRDTRLLPRDYPSIRRHAVLPAARVIATRNSLCPT